MGCAGYFEGSQSQLRLTESRTVSLSGHPGGMTVPFRENFDAPRAVYMSRICHL